MTIDLAPTWRRGVAALLIVGATACHGEGPCTGDDDGKGTLAVAVSINSSRRAESDDGRHIAYAQKIVCSETPVEVRVYEDVPVDLDLVTGELLEPGDRPVATGVAVDEKPATFDVPSGPYLVCWVTADVRPVRTVCTRVEVGRERVVLTFNQYSTNRFSIH